MKKIIVLILTVTASFNAFAGVAKVACTVNDSEGTIVRKMKTFTASSRTSHPLRVTEDGVLYLRWNFHTAPVKVLITKNPHYPFNLPFATKELGRAEIDLDNNYVGVDLSAIKEGYVLNCKKISHK